MSKYTPGPWRKELHDDGAFNVFDNQGRVVVSRSIWGHNAEESHNNAILIAAAPDLLEACEALVKAIAMFGDGEEKAGMRQAALEAGMSAIDKAQGVTK